MTAKIIDGQALADRIRANIAAEIAGIVAAGQPRPGLGVLLVGEDPSSKIYVNNKTRAADEVGVHSEQLNLAADAPQHDVVSAVEFFNNKSEIHAILVQLPLPPQVDAAVILDTIDPRKDADGLHPYNVAALAAGRPRVVPCTPAGIMEILRDEGVEIAGAEVVVVGRSNIVGRPVAALLTQADATVTICHTKTRNLADVTRRGDILIAAAGRAGLITGDMVKPGGTVIDVAMNRLAPSTPGGRPRLVGDCDRASVEQVAGRLTPVPGGVGPMTIAMLLSNTLKAARTAEPAPV